MMSIHLIILVLMVTSRVSFGNDEVLQKIKDDNQQIKSIVGANIIPSSTETNGAINQNVSKSDEPPLITSSPSTVTKESSNHSTVNRGTTAIPMDASSENLNNDPSSISTLEATSSTTARPMRNGAVQSGRNRDIKLMSLLAARRSALKRDRWGTHRRILPTDKSSIESTPKSITNPRATCERNCTKNFTRPITAGCIRRCVNLYKEATTIVNTNSSVAASPRTKVDEKDNNEILETDESSHGFFVVTKDVNDTANHIADGVKPGAGSTEKSNRITSKIATSTVSIEDVDMAPYIFFGQKLPPLRPTVLRPSREDDGSPKILELPPPQLKDRNRLYKTRNFVPYRSHGRGIIKPTTTPTITRPTPEARKQSSSEILVQEVSSEENSTVTVLVRSATEASNNTRKPTTTKVETTTIPTSTSSVTSKRVEHTTSTPVTTLQSSTPLLINVPEVYTEVTKEETTNTPEPAKVNPLENLFIPHDTHEEKPNLIIFYNITTEKPSSIATTPRIYTKTTVSSSVRSTVNPRVNLAPQTTQEIDFTSNDIILSSTPESTTPTIDGFVDISRVYKAVNVKSDTSDRSSIISNSSDVTIEMNRINMATYVLAGLGMFPIVIIILYLAKTVVFKNRSKDDGDLDQFSSDGQPISPVRKMDSDEDSNYQYSIMSDNDFDRGNLRFKSLLGEGNFGQVWKAEADDLTGHLGTTRIVAVKTVRTGSSQLGLKEEADIMRKLGSHCNVVTLLGACIETEPHLLIMEYAMRGRLLSLLRAARSATNILPASVPGGRSLAPLSPRTLAGFALDIARGMEYISEKKIVHRDLAARNVLLDHNGVCKICDFGMSIDLERGRNTQQHNKKVDFIQQTQCFDSRFSFDFGGRLINHWNNNNNEKKHDSVSKRPALPIRWMAPEALQYHIFSTETDVWAFGIVLWEIATLGCTPYPNLSGREVVRSVPNGVRPELSQDVRPEFYDLMTRCWRKDPQQRPTFRESRIEISRSSCKWIDDDAATSDYMDVSGFSEDLEHGMVYFNRRISEFECEI